MSSNTKGLSVLSRTVLVFSTQTPNATHRKINIEQLTSRLRAQTWGHEGSLMAAGKASKQIRAKF